MHKSKVDRLKSSKPEPKGVVMRCSLNFHGARELRRARNGGGGAADSWKSSPVRLNPSLRRNATGFHLECRINFHRL